jgi:hypothetical protein
MESPKEVYPWHTETAYVCANQNKFRAIDSFSTGRVPPTLVKNGIFIVNVLEHPISCCSVTTGAISKYLVIEVICQIGTFVNITNHDWIKACHLFS